MPVDITLLKSYSINYPELFKFIHQQKIFNDPTFQKEYIEAWIDELKFADKQTLDIFDPSFDMIKFLQNLEKEGECFQQEINYSFSNVLIQYRILRLIELIKQTDYTNHISFGSYRDFSSKSRVHWTPVDSNTNIKSTFPILVVEFLSNKADSLVIDGNHRLTHYVKAKSTKIPILNINPQTLIEYDLFSTSFDKLYYIFHNELVKLANFRHFDNLNDMQLFSLSYLKNYTYNFNNPI